MILDRGIRASCDGRDEEGTRAVRKKRKMKAKAEAHKDRYATIKTAAIHPFFNQANLSKFMIVLVITILQYLINEKTLCCHIKTPRPIISIAFLFFS